MKQRALARARRTDNGDFFAGTHGKRNAVDGQRFGARRIGEPNVVKADIAAGGLRQRNRRHGSSDLGLHAKDFKQPLSGAGGGRDLAPDLAQLTEAGGGKRRIEDELTEPARTDQASLDIIRADPEDNHDAGEYDEDHDGGEHGAGPARSGSGLVALFPFTAEALIPKPLARIGLHGTDRTDQFGSIGAGV